MKKRLPRRNLVNSSWESTASVLRWPESGSSAAFGLYMTCKQAETVSSSLRIKRFVIAYQYIASTDPICLFQLGLLYYDGKR